MKCLNVLVVTLLLMFSMKGFAQSELKYGTPVRVMINSYACSENSDMVTGHIDGDVLTADGTIAIPAGSHVIIEAQRESRRGVGHPGMLVLSFRSAQSVDGQSIALSGSKTYHGKDLRRKTLGVGIGVGFFITPMFAFLAKQGEAAEIEANTVIEGIIVAGSYSIN